LLPKDASQAIRGLVYIAANCYAAIGIVDYPERYCSNPDEDVRKRIIAGTRKRLHYLWDVFADTFPARPYLSGERLGALDLLATVVSKWSGARQHLASSRPALSALVQKIENDPRIAAIFARHWPPQ
jgi:GST-like protein